MSTRSGESDSPALTRWPLASVMLVRAVGSAPGLELSKIAWYCSSSHPIISCSSRERDLEVRATPVLRDLLRREAAIDACVGSKVTAGMLVAGVGVVSIGVVVGDAPPWLVGGTLLFVSASD